MSVNDTKRLKLSPDMENLHKSIDVDTKTGNILLKCTLCNKKCDTEMQFEIHQSSKAHLKKLVTFNEKSGSSISSPITEINNMGFYCKICNKNCNTQQQLEIHNTGKAHIKKSFKSTFKEFSSLNITNLNSEISSSNKEFLSFDSTNMNPEISSSNNSVAEPSLEMEINEQAEITHSNITKCDLKYSKIDSVIISLLEPLRETNKITCQLCSNSTNTEEQYQAHCQGSRHIKRLKSYNIPTEFFDKTSNKEIDTTLERCEICDISIHRNNIESHNKGKMHKEKLIKSTATEYNEVDIKKDNLSPNLKNSLKMKPRQYQLEIFEKALQCDCVIFLPTGTGKTLIGAMMILKMLEENPHHRVAFIVDKVLLVMQQCDFLKDMFENVVTERFVSSSQTNIRQIKVIAMANDLFSTSHHCTLRDHDVIVATAELFRNVLKNKQLFWSDLCLVVLDEAHHCVKEHPYNKMMWEYHLYPPQVRLNSHKPKGNLIIDQGPSQPEFDQNKLNEWKRTRCKIVGLTASPAGDVDEECTYNLIVSLLESLGGVDIVSVTTNVEELRNFTSLTEIEVKMINYTPKEWELRNLISENFVFLMHKFERVINQIGNGIVTNENNPLSIDVVANLKSQLSAFLADLQENHQSIVNHLISLVGIIEAIDSIGYQIAFTKFKDLINNENDRVWFENNVFNFTSNSAKIVNAKSESEIDKSSIVSTIVEETRTLGDDNRTVLLLVKERQIAQSLQIALKSQVNNYEVRLLVGHGAKGTKNKQKGMTVMKQKQALDFIREKKNQIIVATSVADEGIDLPDCDLVVIISPPNSVQALVQIRGRARKKSSRLLMLCRDQESIDDLKKLKIKEENIEKSINKLLEKRMLMDNVK